MGLIDADKFLSKLDLDEYYHTNEIRAMVADTLAASNDPLTLEELREMDGEPVWVEVFVKGLKSHWVIVYGKYLSDGRFTEDKERSLLSIDENSGYGLAFLAYRRRPEGGDTNA